MIADSPVEMTQRNPVVAVSTAFFVCRISHIVKLLPHSIPFNHSVCLNTLNTTSFNLPNRKKQTIKKSGKRSQSLKLYHQRLYFKTKQSQEITSVENEEAFFVTHTAHRTQHTHFNAHFCTVVDGF